MSKAPLDCSWTRSADSRTSARGSEIGAVHGVEFGLDGGADAVRVFFRAADLDRPAGAEGFAVEGPGGVGEWGGAGGGAGQRHEREQGFGFRPPPAGGAGLKAPTGRNPHDRVLLHTPPVMKSAVPGWCTSRCPSHQAERRAGKGTPVPSRPGPHQPKSSKAMFSGSTPSLSSIWRQALSISGGPQR